MSRSGPDVGPSSLRALVDNPVLGRFVLSYFTGVVAEWGVFVAALVYAFDRGGPTAAGVASVAMLLAYAVCAPFAGVAAERLRPNRVRIGAYAGETVAFAAAAVSAHADAPFYVVVAWCGLGGVAITFIRPAAAVLVPAIVRSSRELTRANLLVNLCESACVLGGPLLAAVLLGVGGPALALTGCAVFAGMGVLAGVGDLGTDPPPLVAAGEAGPAPVRALVRGLTAAAGRPGGRGVLVAAGSQSVLIGALDLLLVVFAVDVLDLGDAGPAVLGSAFGAGALLGGLAAGGLVGRAGLAPIAAISLATMALATSGLGFVGALVPALLVLPLAGSSRSFVDLSTRMLLQRSAPAGALAGVFAVLEFLAAIGMIAGSLGAQVVIAAAGVEAALVAMGCCLAALLVASWSSLRRADSSADVPIVAISLLRQHPVFAPLAPPALEAVARSAEELAVAEGEVVITEGDAGDQFYVVADGSFDVVMGGEYVRTARRGSGFGEVALLAGVPRTATVVSTSAGQLLAVDRVPFLVAVTGSDSSHLAAWGVIRTMRFDAAVPDVGPR